jgi:ATP-dependent DNA helicase RecQ
MDDSLILAQKILSCVVRLGERFGADYVADVLRGTATDRIISGKHDRLSTYGLLKEHPKSALKGWIDQLLGQGHLDRDDGEYPTLRVTKSGRGILRGEGTALLVRPVTRQRRKAAVAPLDHQEEVETGLFEALRMLRREIAQARAVPPYLIFSDATLREMARLRPLTAEAFLHVKGVGERKQADFGPSFLDCIRTHVRLGDHR